MPAVGELMEIILYVRDMQTQVSFYRDVLGLKVKEPAGVEDFSEVFWTELDTGACTLALHGGGGGRFGADAPRIVFRVNEIEAARSELLKKGVTMGQVRSPVENHFVCDGMDSEGNTFSIESRIAG